MKNEYNNLDDIFYNQVAEEILLGKFNKGLWLKATVDANGNDLQAKLYYTKLRVSQLKKEVSEVTQHKIYEVEQEYIQNLKKLGCKVIRYKDNLLVSGKWIITLKNNKKVVIKTLDDLIEFTLEYQNKITREIKVKNEKHNIQSKNIRILKDSECSIIFNKGGIFSSDKWIVTTRKNKKIVIKSLDELIFFTKKHYQIFLCEKKLDAKGYILSKKGDAWCITDYLGNKKFFNSINTLESFSNS